MSTGPIVSSRGCDAGFTLVELMVALSIFAVGMLGVSAMFTTSIGGNAQGKHMTEATSLAQSKLSELQTATPYADLGFPKTTTEAGLDASGSTVGSTPHIYTRFTHVTTIIPAIGVKRIEVTVSWVSKPSDGSSKPYIRKVTLKTLRAKDI